MEKQILPLIKPDGKEDDPLPRESLCQWTGHDLFLKARQKKSYWG